MKERIDEEKEEAASLLFSVGRGLTKIFDETRIEEIIQCRVVFVHFNRSDNPYTKLGMWLH